MCCTQLVEDTERKKSPEIRHLGTMTQLFRAVSLQLRHASTIEKKLVKHQYLLNVLSQYGKLRSTNSWDWFRSFGAPRQISAFRVLASLLHWPRSLEVKQTLHDVWPSPGLVHYIYIFWGSCPLIEFCQLQNSLCVQVFRSPILVALLHGTRAVGISQTLRHGARNGIKELL